MLESARERSNRVQRERCARQHTESAGPFKMQQDRSNCMRQER